MALESFQTNNLAPALLREVEEFLDSQDTAHVFQFPQWADPGAPLLLQREGGRICWTATLSVHSPLGRKLPWIRAAHANRGPVSNDLKVWAAATEELACQLQREGLAYLDVTPEWIRLGGERDDFLGNGLWQGVGVQRATLRLDLTKSLDEIFANFSKNSRYEVRRAERLGATVSVASSEAEIDEFSRLHQHLAARKGFAAESLERQHRQMRWLMNAGSRGALLLARTENVVRGGVVIGRAGRRCWYIWGASERHLPMNVGHILQWNALQWAKAQGCTEYDFGGYTPGATSGPAFFKAGFGGTEVRFIQPQRRVLNSGRNGIQSFLSKIRMTLFSSRRA